MSKKVVKSLKTMVHSKDGLCDGCHEVTFNRDRLCEACRKIVTVGRK